MDVRYINPFIAAVKHVFKTMLDTDVYISRPLVKEGNSPPSDVSAIIGFSGKAAGSVAMCFPKSSATRVASKFADTALSFHEAVELADALGELTNMVAGQAKANLPDVSVTISLPRVVVGSDHRLIESLASPVLLLPCDSPLGRFHVEVVMRVKKASPFVFTVSVKG